MWLDASEGADFQLGAYGNTIFKLEELYGYFSSRWNNMPCPSEADKQLCQSVSSTKPGNLYSKTCGEKKEEIK